MGLGQVLKKVDAFPKLIDIEVNKTFSGALCEFQFLFSLRVRFLL
jgi:hypothetical protein